MKIALFNQGRVGVVVGDAIVDVTHLVPGHDSGYAQNHWLRLCAGFEALSGALARQAEEGPRTALAGIRLEAPVLNPTKVVCAAANYDDHLAEMNDIMTESQRASSWFLDFDVFLKAPSSIVGPGSVIRLPSVPHEVHHECELAVVIGRTARDVAVDDALDHVLGYTVLVDVTVRSDGDRSRRKSYDTFCPVGPWIVTADEIGDPQQLDIALHVNGVERQAVSTSAMKVPVDAMISYTSKIMTLQPGDVLATGSPAGVGAIRPGDVLTAGIDRIGTMTLGVDGAPDSSA